MRIDIKVGDVSTNIRLAYQYNKYDDINAETICPDCGAILIEKWSGIKCSMCEYWCCY